MRRLPVVTSGAKLGVERLFREHFLPLYPAGVDLAAVRSTDVNPAQNPALIRAARETAELFAKLAGDALASPTLDLDFSDASVHRLSAALSREARDRMLAGRGPNKPSLFVHFVTHGALYVACCALDGQANGSGKRRQARLVLRNPLWETSVELTSKAGVALLSPFWWMLRAWSDESVVTLADRYRTLVEVPTEDVDSWPLLAPADRRLPRLGRVRYDLLFQHLKRHLPELDDFGADFPPPARFEEIGFRFMELDLVGEGRMLLLRGQSRAGVHLLWMNRGGFTKAAFFEADASPEHRFTRGRSSEGVETLVVELTKGGRVEQHEMLWWGP